MALDKATGKTVWKIAREHKTRSYVTPIIREIDGRTQMVFSGSKCIVSLRPARRLDGIWMIDGPTEQFVASMVYDGKLFFMTAGFPDVSRAGHPARRQRQRDRHARRLARDRTPSATSPRPSSPASYLVVADDRGTANCFVAATGERLWQERLGKHFSASLVTAGGLVYSIADDGVTKVVRPGPKLEVVAENPLGEYCYSSPAISQGQIFIRGEKHLILCEGGSKQVSGE